MVAIAPLVRRYRFIPERITLHAEELAYLWQRRRASLRAPDITLPDFTYLQERIEAHLWPPVDPDADPPAVPTKADYAGVWPAGQLLLDGGKV